MALTQNVNAGDKIQSSWGNTIRDRTIQQFTDFAQLNSQWAAAPENTFVTVAGKLYQKRSGAWVPITTIWSASDNFSAQISPNTGGYVDRPMTIPTTPAVQTVVRMTSMAYAGFSSGGITSLYLSIFSNSLTSPAGGAWIIAGANAGAVPGGTWVSLGSITYVLPLTPSVTPHIAARVAYSPATINCHVNIITFVELLPMSIVA